VTLIQSMTLIQSKYHLTGEENNKLYFFLHALIVFMSRLAVTILDRRYTALQVHLAAL